jgi:outer membrane immunogenic protein
VDLNVSKAVAALKCRRSFVLASATVLAVISLATIPASAADLAAQPYRKAPAFVEPVSSWTGFYVGANGGYGWNNSKVTATPGDPNTANIFLGQVNVATASTSFDSKGWFGGLQAGYNWQFDPRWLVGVETDFDWSDINGSGSAPTTVAFGATPATFSASEKVEWFGTLRGRIGYLPTPDLLLYATGGLAYGKVNASASVVLPPGLSNSSGNFGFGYGCGAIYGGSTCFAGSGSRTSAGWTAGGGAEYRFTRNVSVKLEYLYVNLGNNAFPLPAAHFTTLLPSVLNASGETAFNLVRVGVNYRF